MAPHAHAPTDLQRDCVHGDDGYCSTSLLIAVTGLCVLVGTSFAAIAAVVSRHAAGLGIGWRPPPTIVWFLAGAGVAALAWLAVMAPVLFPDRLRVLRRRR
jgi:uncharacterized membrane protein